MDAIHSLMQNLLAIGETTLRWTRNFVQVAKWESRS